MSLPTPAEDALRVYLRRVMDHDDSVEAERMLDAAIRADRLRVLEEIETRWRNARRGFGLIATLRDMRREIEQP